MSKGFLSTPSLIIFALLALIGSGSSSEDELTIYNSGVGPDSLEKIGFTFMNDADNDIVITKIKIESLDGAISEALTNIPLAAREDYYEKHANHYYMNLPRELDADDFFTYTVTVYYHHSEDPEMELTQGTTIFSTVS